MSHADYQASQGIARELSLNALIMAAMQKARRPDLEKLRAVFSDIWVELTERERCCNGLLTGERVVSESPVAAPMPTDTKAWINSPTGTEGVQ